MEFSLIMNFCPPSGMRCVWGSAGARGVSFLLAQLFCVALCNLVCGGLFQGFPFKKPCVTRCLTLFFLKMLIRLSERKKKPFCMRMCNYTFWCIYVCTLLYKMNGNISSCYLLVPALPTNPFFCNSNVFHIGFDCWSFWVGEAKGWTRGSAEEGFTLLLASPALIIFLTGKH